MALLAHTPCSHLCTHKCRHACAPGAVRNEMIISHHVWGGLGSGCHTKWGVIIHYMQPCHWPLLHVIQTILLTCAGKQLMCINWMCNNYGCLVSDLVTRLNLWALMWCWSMADSFCSLARVSSYYIIEMRVPFHSVSLVYRALNMGKRWNFKNDCLKEEYK